MTSIYGADIQHVQIIYWNILSSYAEGQIYNNKAIWGIARISCFTNILLDNFIKTFHPSAYFLLQNRSLLITDLKNNKYQTSTSNTYSTTPSTAYFYKPLISERSSKSLTSQRYYLRTYKIAS
jgi:hypothetical protein